MNPLRSTIPILLFASIAAGSARAAESPRPRAVPAPLVHMSWRAPWGEPRATQALVADCADSTTADTLYLTLESPDKSLPLLGLTATVLFEPLAGDTLDAFWFLERGDANEGSLLLDFDSLASESCDSPWHAYVAGSVGYTRAGGRGRLDLSASVPRDKVLNLFPNHCYFVARVTIKHSPAHERGCGKPMRITWAGGRFRSTRPGSEELPFGIGDNPGVTWNASKAGVWRSPARLAVATWVPRFAPPSRAVLARQQARPVQEYEK